MSICCCLGTSPSTCQSLRDRYGERVCHSVPDFSSPDWGSLSNRDNKSVLCDWWIGSRKSLKTQIHKCFWHTYTWVIHPQSRLAEDTQSIATHVTVLQVYVSVRSAFSRFPQTFRMWKSAGWRTRADRCRDMKSTCWILMSDDLITRANLLPFLWMLAHKGFMNSFSGLKSSNSDPMKGSESYKRIVKTGFLLFLCVRAVIYTFYNLMEQCMIFYLFSEVTIVCRLYVKEPGRHFFFLQLRFGEVKTEFC